MSLFFPLHNDRSILITDCIRIENQKYLKESYGTFFVYIDGDFRLFFFGDHWPLIGIEFFWFIHFSILPFSTSFPLHQQQPVWFLLSVMNMNFSYAMFCSIWMSHIDFFATKTNTDRSTFFSTKPKIRRRRKKNLITHNNSFMHYMLCILDLCFL